MKKTSVILAAVITVCLLLQTFSLAWISDNGLSSLVNITGNVHKNYFEGGDGSAEDPYIIARPVQLYYFAWLQYLGFFNPDENGDKKIDTTYYFKLSENLDMKENGVQYVLPPIGTTDNPFVGNFDGDGYTISNLVVRNNYNSLSAPPNNTENFGGAEIIGFFGVIGSPPNYAYTYDSEANQISNFVLENITVETQTDKALIGMIAGYVNGLVDKVGVVGSTVSISKGTPLTNITDNMSDYALIGFCTEDFKGKLYSLDLYIYDPETNTYQVIPDKSNGGDGQGWGGSVKMTDIFNWLNKVNDYADNNTRFYVSRTDVIDLSGKHVTLTNYSSYETKTEYSVNVSGSSNVFGTFVFGYKMNASGNTDVNFVGGGQKVTEFKYSRETGNKVNVYYIRNSNNQYITFNGSTLGTTSSTNSAAKWYVTQENGKTVTYTVYNNNVYYLSSVAGSLNVYSSLDVDHDNLPSWTASGNGYVGPNSYRISVSIRNNNNTTTYYLAPNSSNNGITATTTGNTNSTLWSINAVSGGYTVTTVINNTTYYLSHTNNALGLTNTQSANTTWNYSNNTLSYSSGNNRSYYLRYNNNWTLAYNNNTGTAPTFTTVSGASITTTSAGTDDNIKFNKNVYIDKSTNNRYYDTNGNEIVTGVGITYFPLSSTVTGTTEANTQYAPSTGNTGYIIGAGWGIVDPEAGIEELDSYDSNIRISQYSNSMTNVATPYTMTFNNYKGGVFEQTPSLATDGSAPTATQKESINKLGLVKYADCYADYRSSIVNNLCYGLHFMKASVSSDNTTYINAYLNGEWYPNYEVPLNCIDFNLYERGFINFVAGSYYKQTPNNDSFFSIYQIFRTGAEIDEIKEIYKIYGKVKKVDQVDQIDTSEDYVYTYVAYEANGTKYEVDANGNRVTNGISGLTMIFDCDWITNPTNYMPSNANGFNDKAFYFEVPVNAGEYAIGSTKDKTGAYLVYLDLAANAQIIDRTRVDEMIVTEERESEIPKGVSILENKSEGTSNIKPENSAFISIGTNNPGGSLTQSGSVITDSGSGHTAVYIGPDLQLVDANGPMTVPITKTVTIEQSTYYDVNIVTGNRTVTVIRKITEETAEGKKTYYAKLVTVTTAAGEPAYDVNENPLSKDWEESNDPLYPDVQDDEKVNFSDKLLLGMGYVVSDPEAVTVEHNCTVELNDDNIYTYYPVHTISITNTAAAPLPVAFTLTEYGVSKNIQFIVVAGGEEKTLANNINKQSVTVPVQQIAP